MSPTHIVCKMPLLARHAHTRLNCEQSSHQAKRDDRVSCIEPFFSSSNLKLLLRPSTWAHSITDFFLRPASWLTLYIGDLSSKNLGNRLPFELQCWSATHFEGFVELSALPLYIENSRKSGLEKISRLKIVGNPDVGIEFPNGSVHI